MNTSNFAPYLSSMVYDYHAYRNRSGAVMSDYMFPILQPDIYVHNAFTQPRHRIRTWVTAQSTDTLINLFQGSLSEFTDTLHENWQESGQGVPIVHVHNMYGYMEQWEEIVNEAKGNFDNLVERDVSAMLIGHPNHKVQLLQSGNYFLVLTNSIKIELFPKINAAIFSLRTAQDLILKTVADPEIYDGYVENILCDNVNGLLELFQMLINIRIEQEEAGRLASMEQEFKDNVALLKTKWLQQHTAGLTLSIEQLRTSIEETLRNLRQMYRQLKQKQLIQAGIKGDSAVEQALELFETELQEAYHSRYLKRCVFQDGYGDRLHNDSQRIYRLQFLVADTLKYWNDEYAQILYENSDSVVWRYTDSIARMFKAIFIDRTVQLKVSMAFDFQVENDGRVSDVKRTNNQTLFDDTRLCGLNHPHIMEYDCWGDNSAMIYDALNKTDYVTAWAVCHNVLQSLALADGAVVERLLNRMRQSINENWYVIDGNTCTFKQVIEILEARDAQAAVQQEEQEEVIPLEPVEATAHPIDIEEVF